MKPDMGPDAITERLRLVASLADLRPERRCDPKIDYGADAITRRLRKVDALNRLCARLG